MIINYVSDIHTEFWVDDSDYFNPGTGEVLVLAGDIGCAYDLYDSDSMFQRFLQDCVKGYDKVFMVMGNHSHYDFNFLETEQAHRDLMPKGITLLENQSEFYNGVHFVGCTLWTDFNNASGYEMQRAQSIMNDYHCVSHGDRALTPSDTLHEHDTSIFWLNQVLPTLRGDVVLITHHCPSHKSLSGHYAGESSAAYASNLTHFVETYAPRAIIHGHCHHPASYTIGTTKVESNPRGYAPNAINPNYQVKQIEV
jgi:predicted phosphohydrolase